MKNNDKKQTGSLLISAAVLITLIAIMSAGVSYIASSKSSAASDLYNRVTALYVAEAGLQHAGWQLNANGISCSTITGDSSFTNITFSNGQFSVTTNTLIASPAPTLGTAINNSTTIIPVSSLSNLASTGRVMVNREFIDYTSTSTLASDCNSDPPCLTGATRGADNSTPVSHASGTPVGQHACQITSIGSIPNSNNPIAESQLGASLKALPFGFLLGRTVTSHNNLEKPSQPILREMVSNS